MPEWGTWEPIETAPQDGTMLLLAPHMVVGWWEFGDNNWQMMNVPLNTDRTIAHNWKEQPKLWFCVALNMFGLGEPTHWMPLPEPPEGIDEHDINERLAPKGE
jgi:hypothetical protein